MLQTGSNVTGGQQHGGAVTVSLEETHVEVHSVCHAFILHRHKAALQVALSREGHAPMWQVSAPSSYEESSRAGQVIGLITIEASSVVCSQLSIVAMVEGIAVSSTCSWYCRML